MLLILVVLVFGGTFVVAAVSVVVAAAVQRGSRAVKPAARRRSPQDEPVLLRQEQSSSLPLWKQLLDRLNLTQILKDQINEAGMRWSVGRVTLAMLLLGSLCFAFLVDASWAPIGTPFIGAWLGGSIPYWIIRNRRAKRLGAIEDQFPDALDSLARAMRAGHALSSAIALLAAECPLPLGPEFRKLADENRLGLSWPVALDNFARRVPILEVRLFVAAVVVQTRTGGKLTDVLERLAETIRETSALRGEVKAISAQGRLTGLILTAMPLFIGAAMYLSNPSYITLLFTDPTGNILVWCALGCMLLGHFIIQKIVDIRAPQ